MPTSLSIFYTRLAGLLVAALFLLLSFQLNAQEDAWSLFTANTPASGEQFDSLTIWESDNHDFLLAEDGFVEKTYPDSHAKSLFAKSTGLDDKEKQDFGFDFHFNNQLVAKPFAKGGYGNVIVFKPYARLPIGRNQYIHAASRLAYDLKTRRYHIPLSVGIGQRIKSGRYSLDVLLAPEFNMVAENAQSAIWKLALNLDFRFP